MSVCSDARRLGAIHLCFDGRLEVFGRLAELAEPLAQAARQLRELGGAEHDQGDGEDDRDFPKAETEHP